MIRHGAIEAEFGDGKHSFRLGLKEIEELEEKCSLVAKRDVGIFELVDLLHPKVRRPRVKFVTETIRIGLIGGGMTPIDAMALVARYCDERPLEESRDVAFAVAAQALLRVHPGDLGEDSGEARAVEPDGSTSPPSTAEP